MKIIALSDTHTYHRQIKDIPDGDVLVHCGDITFRGEIAVLEDFAYWMKELPHKHKIFIAGNHDRSLERDDYKRGMLLELFDECGITYLQDSGIDIDGVKFWGAPWTPVFHNWSFNLPRGRALEEKWALIPDDTNVLLTHGPPWQILDKAPRGVFDFEHTGCANLLERILELRQLQTHVFGHIHADSGSHTDAGVQFVNASICTEDYKPTNPSRIINIKGKPI